MKASSWMSAEQQMATSTQQTGKLNRYMKAGVAFAVLVLLYLVSTSLPLVAQPEMGSVGGMFLGVWLTGGLVTLAFLALSGRNSNPGD